MFLEAVVYRNQGTWNYFWDEMSGAAFAISKGYYPLPI
jgi:hypothetical protein